MNRTICTALLALSMASVLPAASLSVVPLAEALKNPALADTKSEGFEQALADVTALMLNKPPETEEGEAYKTRVSSLARHRDTRVGKLFFAALHAVPVIENLPEDATSATITADWPLALGASLRVRAAFTLRDETWLISGLDVTADGVAAAPVAGMAPYFGDGRDRIELLNMEALDYLLGRDPADRELPDLERPEFDYDAAITRVFEAEAGAFETLMTELVEKVSPAELPDVRMNALREHLASQAEIEAMEAANLDEAKQREFWDTMYEQLKLLRDAARPASVAKTAGARVSVLVVRESPTGTVAVTSTALRLRSGKIAPRGGEERS